MSQEILDEIAPLTNAFNAAGNSLYLVGGIVRDLHLGVPLVALDFDLTTDARPAKIKELVGPLADAVWAQGEKFGTIGCRIGDRPYEITTHRADSYGEGSRKPEVKFGDDIELDLSRRDFTINAMAVRAALDVADAELIDPFGGAQHLEQRLLRTPIEPEVSFQDDPLRILRAARFIARYDLSVQPELFAAAESLIDRMRIVSAERVRDEFDKLLVTHKPSDGLEFLRKIGGWAYVADTIPVESLDQLGAELDRSRVQLDLRRVLVFSYCSSKSRAVQLESLRYSSTEARSIRLTLAGLDLVSHGGQDFQASTVRRLIDRVGYRSMPLLFDVIEVRDMFDRGLRRLYAELNETEDLSDLSPELTGDDIMDILGIEAGPEVGAALGVLQERRFEEGPASREDEVAYLLQKYKRR